MVERIDKLKNYVTDCSPSHLFNNLSNSENSIIYIHNSESQPRIITVNKE